MSKLIKTIMFTTTTTAALFIFTTSFILLLLSSIVSAADYYIDYETGDDNNDGLSTSTPWKYAPGMDGWSGSATLSSGDTVVFKGGVTWTFSSTTADLMVLTVPVTIKGGQQLQTPWGLGLPVWDATGTTSTARAGISWSGLSDITIDGIKIYNTQYPNVGSSGGSGVYFRGACSNIEIKNCIFNFTGDQSIRGGPYDGSSSILIHNNTFSNVGRLFIAVADDNSVDDIQIYNNDFLGVGDWNNNNGATHGDGIMIGSACEDANDCLTNISIHHNRFYGDWAQGVTALIFLNNGAGAQDPTDYGGNHAEIYNNQITVDTDGDNGQVASPALMWIYCAWNDVKIYGNTFDAYMGTYPSTQALFVSQYATNVEVKNNIFSGVTHSAIAGASTSFTAIDYNLYSPSITRIINGWIGNQDCRDITTCYSNFGVEQHGIQADPDFTTPPNGVVGYGNWTLRSSSPAIDKGTDLSAYFTTDKDGVSRPQGSGWDIGAYEYTSATSLVGDLNNDGLINIQDIQACVNHILGTQDWGAVADVNADSSVNVLDVQAIVNIILG